jgi:hypothetical protein
MHNLSCVQVCWLARRFGWQRQQQQQIWLISAGGAPATTMQHFQQQCGSGA